MRILPGRQNFGETGGGKICVMRREEKAVTVLAQIVTVGTSGKRKAPFCGAFSEGRRGPLCSGRANPDGFRPGYWTWQLLQVSGASLSPLRFRSRWQPTQLFLVSLVV